MANTKNAALQGRVEHGASGYVARGGRHPEGNAKRNASQAYIGIAALDAPTSREDRVKALASLRSLVTVFAGRHGADAIRAINAAMNDPNNADAAAGAIIEIQRLKPRPYRNILSTYARIAREGGE